jgi:predicted solute-binding protein
MQIAAVPYCNAFPLIHYLPEFLPGAVISEWLPSQMRQQLAERKLDMALLPVAELMFLPQTKIVSNCCIACNGAVRSVLLFSRKPIEQIRSMALDTASRSSVMICELILRHFYGLQPEKHRLEGDQNPDDCRTDAFVIIGDRALAYRPSDCWQYRYDIGELWKAKTGLPLVFAAWVGCSSQAFDDPVASALESSRDKGLRHLETILDAKERQGIVLPIDREQILDYYRRAIIYTMAEQEHAGVQRFFDLMRQ